MLPQCRRRRALRSDGVAPGRPGLNPYATAPVPRSPTELEIAYRLNSRSTGLVSQLNHSSFKAGMHLLIFLHPPKG